MLTNSVAYCDPTLTKKLIYLVEDKNLTNVAKELKLYNLRHKPVLCSRFHSLDTDALGAFSRYPLPGNIYLGEYTLKGFQQAQFLNTTCYVNWKELILLKDTTPDYYNASLYNPQLRDFLNSDLPYKNYINLGDPLNFKNNLCKKK